MARYRLKSAHYITGDKYLLGDTEMSSVPIPIGWTPKPGQDADHRGEIVGDGTEHEVKWPTLEMEPLDDEAKDMIEKEQERLAANNAAMNPVENLSLEMDSYEENYVPGLNVRRKPAKADGAPAREKSNA